MPVATTIRKSNDRLNRTGNRSPDIGSSFTQGILLRVFAPNRGLCFLLEGDAVFTGGTEI